jgi:cell division protein FtsB
VNVKHKLFLFLSILGLFSLCGFIILGDDGLAELKLLKQDHQRMVDDNESIARNNLLLYSEIDRLQTDLGYIRDVARQQLGFIGKDAFILKPNNNN